MLEHRHTALTVRALMRNPSIHRQHAQQRQCHDQQRRQWRQRTGCQGGDAGQIGQRREVVHTRQAHDLPPRLRLGVALISLRADRLDTMSQQPAGQRMCGLLSGRRVLHPRRTGEWPDVTHSSSSSSPRTVAPALGSLRANQPTRHSLYALAKDFRALTSSRRHLDRTFGRPRPAVCPVLPKKSELRAVL